MVHFHKLVTYKDLVSERVSLTSNSIPSEISYWENTYNFQAIVPYLGCLIRWDLSPLMCEIPLPATVLLAVIFMEVYFSKPMFEQAAVL